MRNPELVAEAQRLRYLGLTYMAIGLKLGVGAETARRWLRPIDELRAADQRRRDRHTPEERRAYYRKWYAANRERKCAADRRRYAAKQGIIL